MRKVPAKQVLVCCLALAAIALPRAEADSISAGPLVSQFHLTLAPGEREEVLGPVFYSQWDEGHDLTAMPPLWSCLRNHEINSTELNVLYPIVSYYRFGDEYRFQFLQIISFSGGRTQDETNKHRISLFPFYFQQRSPIPSENYTAVFPFYGNLQNRFFRDEIHFVMWPGYVQTRKKDVVTDNYLVPFFDVRHGNGLHGWQFWPLFGHEHKVPTMQTNNWGDVETVPGHDKMFTLWPIFFKQTTGIGTDHPGHRLLVLPLFARQTSFLRDTTSAPWPIGVTYTVDREKKYHEWGAPWPLVVFARGEGKTTSRVWPFFSQSHNDTLEDNFYLWPVYKFNRVHAPPLDRQRTRILFFLASDIVEKNTETGQAKHRVDVWPFLTYRRDWDGNVRWQALSILEPFLPFSPAIERNYSPLWSFWRSEKNAQTGDESQSLFWNLYRHDLRVTTNTVASTTVTNQKSSLLFGLVQWRVTPEGRKARWFYLPAETSY